MIGIVAGGRRGGAQEDMNGDKKILIIEPDGAVAREMLDFFLAEDYSIDVCRDLLEAVELLKNESYDCAIVDVDLPGLKGSDAVRIIKALGPKMRVIVTAKRNSRELEAEVRRQDIFYYYISSFDRRELKLAVRGVFEKLGKLARLQH